MNSQFYGRKNELNLLLEAIRRKSANLIVLKGRRRIGKSRLLEELSKYVEKAYFFAGIAPTAETRAQAQREEFARQLSRNLGMPLVKADDWGDLFWFLADATKQGQVLIVLDEITWMGSADPDFLGKLKNAWDTHFKKNPECTVVICGSMSAWIEKNILGSTGFLGRPTLDMTLKELPLDKCAAFWGDRRVAAYEMLKILAVTGGVPRYLELMNPDSSAEKNIQRLCFSPSGILNQEFDNIFSDLFERRSAIYKSIMLTLVERSKSLSEIAEDLDTSKSGRFSEYLNDLLLSGFIRRDYAWSLKTGKRLQRYKYQISDNYSRFYLKYIAPKHERIRAGAYQDVSLDSLPGWYTMLGLQFENTVINNRQLLLTVLGLKNVDILYDGPYFQTATQRQEGCQVDYLIQTHTNNLYVIEIKFSKSRVKKSVCDEVRTKIEKMALPRGMSVRPVLVHVSGVEKPVMESDFFTKIIDFSTLLGVSD